MLRELHLIGLRLRGDREDREEKVDLVGTIWLRKVWIDGVKVEIQQSVWTGSILEVRYVDEGGEVKNRTEEVGNRETVVVLV